MLRRVRIIAFNTTGKQAEQGDCKSAELFKACLSEIKEVTVCDKANNISEPYFIGHAITGFVLSEYQYLT